MGRRKKQTDVEDAIKTAPPGGNGFDTKKTRSYVDRIETLRADIASIMLAALTECKAVHTDIKEVYQEAKDEAGLPKKELKCVIKARALERKAAEIREELEGEQQDNFDMLRQELGDLSDTPLGAAALRRLHAAGWSDNDIVGKVDRPAPSQADPPFAAPPDEPHPADATVQ